MSEAEKMKRCRESVLHALRTTGPVAVVEVEAFALQDKGTDTILQKSDRGPIWRAIDPRLTCPFETVRRACRGILTASECEGVN